MTLNRTTLYRAVLILGLLFLGVAPPAQAAEDAPRLLTAYEFSTLTTGTQLEYLRSLRALLSEVEKEQSDRGMKYGTAHGLHPYLRWLIEEASAQTQWIAGGKCVFAGRISTYAAPQTPSCINRWKCPENARLIECNPALFGDGVCTAAKDGATARCMQELKEQNIKDEDLVRDMLSDAKKMQRWDDFKKEFDDFCVGQNILKDSKDQNYRSCKRIQARIDALTKQLKLPRSPATTEVPPKPEAAKAEPPKAETPPAKPEPVISDACTKEGEQFCGMNCPAPNTFTEHRPAEVKDIEFTKYGELIKAMETNCKITNGSDVDQIEARSAQVMLDRLGYCSRDEYRAYRIGVRSAEQDKIISQIVHGDQAMHEKLSGNLWFKPEISHAFASYFGLEQKEARKIFCAKTSAQQNRLDLMGLSEYPEIGYGMQPSAKELEKLVRWPGKITKLPEWAQRRSGDDPGSDSDRLLELNRFLMQYRFRNELLSCLRNKINDPYRASIPVEAKQPRKCYRDTYKVGEDSGLTLAEYMDYLMKNQTPALKQPTVCLTINGNSWRCHNCRVGTNGKSQCDCFKVGTHSGPTTKWLPAELTTLRCGGSTAPATTSGGSSAPGRAVQSIEKK